MPARLDINWESNIISNHQYNKELNESFLSFLYDGNLDQLINFPTRKDNTLDILLTTNNTLTSNIIDVPGISDHTRTPVVDVLYHKDHFREPFTYATEQIYKI